ncbi:hypothetical protein GCM10027290_44730 [Micromonospora sonneratiae]|uniref:FHA domain-containing protein n=1 Tax=Micromonospora sonneratiae TaxID=1184706 RepID=A0ABW3Y6Z9_9ACTN
MRPERHLTLDVSAADFVVDLSNIMRERGICSDREVDPQRFDALIAALAAYTSDESVQVYAVADGSLLRHRGLTATERGTLNRWFHRGRIEVRPGADDRILELADTAELRVVSGDNYLDAYRTYPWLADNRDRFVWVAAKSDGDGLVIVPRIMPSPPEWQISRKEEESKLLVAGMYDRRNGTGVRRGLLKRLWRCPVDDCPLFGADGPADQPLPVFRDGVVRCPTHRSPMTDIGPADSRIQVKVRIDGVVRTRFMVRTGIQTVVGRSPGEPGVALPRLTGAAREWVSRRHVQLTWNGSVLVVRDVSANGTRVRREGVSGRGRRIDRWRDWNLRKGEVIVLYDGVELLVSGRTFVFDADPGVPVQPAEVASEADLSTMVRRRPGIR